ncbi:MULTISPECIES: sensor histidine kinase [unclassified Paenibacillus]|uniref:sensor histidine kinase n=1 Tax=unclassified Paenibacillus TaxID=185978 RepID=UPI00277F27F2|nr:MULTISPECIES: ATP-binding protein [unclassified Paenibacillus]MDQ0902396.1 two-component system sensor histidine kinase ComP [Paenibacillus sp. V4I7]MDQ0919093.1 two-component system sensor histidine kinase ComP [Paenibacillus sp. V4I5]
MRNKYAIGLCVSIFIVLQIWCSFITFHFPYIGIYLENTPEQQWVIKEIDHESASSKLDVKVGDIVKQVDGKLPDEFLYVQKWKVTERAQNLLISRGGSEHKVEVNVDSPIARDMIPLIEEFVCLFMAGLLVMKMRHSPSARMLSAVFLTMAIIFMSLGASIRGDAIGKLLIASFMMVLPIVFLHFLIVFFKEKGDIELPTRILKYLYAIAIIALGLRSGYFYPSMVTFFQYDGSVTLIFFIIGFVINMSVLTFLYVKVRKQQSYVSSIINSVWLSLLISFLPVICFSILPKLIMGERILNAIYTSWIILFFPISFAYLIASNQLYDIGLVVRRFLFAGLLSILPVSLFTGAYVFLFRHIVEEKQILFIFVGLMLLVSTVLYAAEYGITRLEPFLFPRKFALQSALKKISKNLGTISSFRELKEIILVDIVGTLQVMGGAIVFQYKNDNEIIYEGEIDTSEVQQLIKSSSILDHPSYTCMVMNSHEEYTSYLIMTRKKTNTLLSKEEIQWLHLITSYLEVSLENVHLIRKLTVRLQQFASELPHETAANDILWFRKVMFELQEEERIRIANDLHDTTMQDLFFLKRRISSLADKSTMHQEDQLQLKNMNNFVEMINASLRQSCFELNPHLLKEVGLIQTLKMYLEKESYTTPFELEFQAGHAAVIETKDLLTKRHIFRIVQELLNNAKKHSQATKVTFQIVERDNNFRLIYEDDGVGFHDRDGVHPEIGASGMGIEQMRSRVLHVGGRFELNTQKGSGTKFIITIPTEEMISA